MMQGSEAKEAKIDLATLAALEKAADKRRFPVHSDTRRRYPHCPKSVPWSFVASHERQAQANHDQTLERLAERGGLGATEMFCVVHDLRLTAIRHDDSTERVAVVWLANAVDYERYAALRTAAPALLRVVEVVGRIHDIAFARIERGRAETRDGDALLVIWHHAVNALAPFTARGKE